MGCIELMTLRKKLYVTVSLPIGLALATFYTASLADGSDATTLFRLAVTFLVAAVLLGCVTWSAHKVQDVVVELVVLRNRVDALETGHQEAANARRATQAWRQEGMTGTDARLLRLVPHERPEDN
jgi:hypothetical protein